MVREGGNASFPYPQYKQKTEWMSRTAESAARKSIFKDVKKEPRENPKTQMPDSLSPEIVALLSALAKKM